MKYLFVVQGEGRGHFTQALVMQERIRMRGDEIAAFLVGKSSARQLPDYFLNQATAPVIQFESPNFLPAAQNKRPGLWKSVFYNLLKLPVFISNMNFIRKQIKLYKPDIVLNFYELLTGLTYLFMPLSIPMVCIGHQYMFLHRKFRFPKKSPVELFFLKFFTRLTSMGADRRLALSFYPMGDDISRHIVVVPPLLRSEVTRLEPVKGDYILGYMLNSGYLSEISKWHEHNPEETLHFFWDKKDAAERLDISSTFSLFRINDKSFLKQMAGCKAYSTTAGFESVCEALYLQKPVLMVPAHIEQECNAFDALRAGAGIVSDNFDLSALLQSVAIYKPNTLFRRWVANADTLIFSELKEVYLSHKYPERKGLIWNYHA